MLFRSQQQNVLSTDVLAASGASNTVRPTMLHGRAQSPRCSARTAQVAIAWPPSHSPRNFQVPPHPQVPTPLSRAAARSKAVGARRTCAVWPQQMQNPRRGGLKFSANLQTTALCISPLRPHLLRRPRTAIPTARAQRRSPTSDLPVRVLTRIPQPRARSPRLYAMAQSARYSASRRHLCLLEVPSPSPLHSRSFHPCLYAPLTGASRLVPRVVRSVAHRRRAGRRRPSAAHHRHRRSVENHRRCPCVSG